MFIIIILFEIDDFVVTCPLYYVFLKLQLHKPNQ